MIKTFITTAAAISMMAGVAFAQQSSSPAALKASDGTTTAVSASSTTQSASSDSVNGRPGASSPGAMPTRMPASPTMTANMPAGDAPSAYPFCTKKGQDRCKQRHAM